MEPTYREIGEFAYSIFFIFSQENAALRGGVFRAQNLCCVPNRNAKPEVLTDFGLFCANHRHLSC